MTNEMFMKIPDEMIEVDSEKGNEFGFTSDKFGRSSYLWEGKDAITISFIESLKKGNFKQLVDAITSKGLAVEIPTPLPNMERIVRKNNYKHIIIDDPVMGEVDVWVYQKGPE